MRTTTRFTGSRATLLAAGTTYYLFLALFSVLTLAYGLTAALGAEQLSDYITEALSAAFPGLVGGAGINPEDLRSIGQTTTIISAVGLLYGATGAVLAASRSLHAVYGAPREHAELRLGAGVGPRLVPRARAAGAAVVRQRELHGQPLRPAADGARPAVGRPDGCCSARWPSC